MSAVSQQIVLSIPDGVSKPQRTATTTTPGVEQNLFVYITTSGKKTRLHILKVTCRQWGKWTLYADAFLIASGRTGPGHLDSSYLWISPDEFQGGVQIKLSFLAGVESKPSDIEAYLQLTEI